MTENPGMRDDLRRTIAILAVLGVAGGVVVGILIATSSFADDRGAQVVSTLLIGWSFIGTGLFAWWRRPRNLIGVLMVAVGFSWLVQGLIAADNPWLFTIGGFLSPLAYGFLIHMMLAFPDGRLHTRLERLTVIGVYVDVIVLQVASTLFFEPSSHPGECTGCPSNHLLISDSKDVVEFFSGLQTVLALVVIVLLGVALWRHWRPVPAAQRRQLMPVLATTAFALAVVVLRLVAQAVGASDHTTTLLFIGVLVSLAVVPFAFLAGILRSRLSRAEAVSELVASLGSGVDRRRRMRDALAEALGDPELRIAYRVNEGWVDADGLPAEMTEGPGQVTALWTDDGWTSDSDVSRQPIAAVIYDGSLAEERELIRAIGGAIGLALENERLDAELRANLKELRASRARIVEAGYRERRRVERDLHDGAQQRLMALGISLRLARTRMSADPAAAGELIDEAMTELAATTAELREFARGIHPAVLTDRGIDAALDGLASRSPIPVEVLARPGERFSGPVESTAYFVIAEALTNVARYADAQTARVRIERVNGYVEVEIADDGSGGADPAAGTGLSGLADRVAALDGVLKVESPPGAGTTVSARIPCG